MSINLPRGARKAQSASHARAPKMEKETAKRIGGLVTPGSGAGRLKGDVRLKGVVRIEAKTTLNKSFPITEELISKIETATVGTGEIPVMQIEILGGKRKCLVLPDWALDQILDALKGPGECS